MGAGKRKNSVEDAPSSSFSERDAAQPSADVEKRANKQDVPTGDPFGDESSAAVQYRTMEWWQASLVMIAETVSLGILSLPSVLAGVGIIAGVILIVGIGIIATYTGYVFGQFKARYPHVHNMADAGEVVLGRFGKEIFGAAQVIFLIFVMGSHLLTFTIAMNAITGHATCTIVWSVLGVVVFILFSTPRTLRNVSYFSIVAFISIISAILIAMIGIGIDPPDPMIQAVAKTNFTSAFASALNVIFAYGGHVAFFTFISEFKDPREFPKALFVLQACDTGLYLIVAVVIYRYAGVNVQSPALGSASSIVMKVAYGIALPTIVIAGVIYAHVNAKYIYVRLFRGTQHMGTRTWLAAGSWLGIVVTLWVIAWIIAESIPVFNDLVSLISALFISWFTFALAGVFWLFINYGQWLKNGKKTVLSCINAALIALGVAICGIGLYASGTMIRMDSGSGHSWSCADNTMS